MLTEIDFSYYVPQNKSRWFLLAWFTLGFFLVILIVSSGVRSVVIIVTTLFSIHCWIWNFLSSLIQWRMLNYLSEMLLISFGGHPLISLALPTTATPSSLPPINIRGEIKNLSIPTTYFFVLLSGGDSMIMSVLSMTFFPYSFLFPTLAAGITL